MEESEKRRERLRVMRMEAAQTEVSSNFGTSAMPGSLSNPLIEASAEATHLLQNDARAATPRFDYYTDPVAAYSGNKRRSNVGNQIVQDYSTPPSYSGSPMARPLPGPRNPVMTTPPAYQFHSNYPPDPRMYQAQGPCYSPGPQRSPAGMASPFPMHQGTPEIWNRSGGTPRYTFPSYPSRDSNFPSPGFGPTGSPRFNYGQGRAHWLGNSPRPGSGHGGSPSPSSGRGRGHWFGRSMSPGLGRSGGRRPRSYTHGSGPEQFYQKSMEEDPWKFLKPAVWRRLDAPRNCSNTPDSPKSWMPNSISAKKTRVLEVSNKSSSQPSLAEYLAASFNEAVNDAPSM